MKGIIKYYLECILGKFLISNPIIRSFSKANPDDELVRKLTSLNVHRPTPLCKIMIRENSDKGIARHNYTTVYNALLSDWRQKQIDVFEMGIGTNNTGFAFNMGKNGTPGASLRGWGYYFPNAQIFGADVDRGSLFAEEQIKTYYCDQLDSSAIQNMWNEIGNAKKFDLILDDGLHTYDANISLFVNSIDKLSKNGYYIVEDVKIDDLERWEIIIQEEYLKKYSDLVFLTIKVPNRPLRNIKDNNLVVIFNSRN